MKAGTKIQKTSQDLNLIAGDLAKRYPDSNTNHDAVKAETELVALLGDTRRALLIIQGAVAIVLLMACVNIAGLLLSRVRDRQREIAVRAALGAGQRRIVRQLLVESLILGGIGGIGGCCIAFVCTPAIVSLVHADIPRAASAGVDLKVLVFAVTVSLLSRLSYSEYFPLSLLPEHNLFLRLRP
jgi:putative ABC transport system permease protein